MNGDVLLGELVGEDAAEDTDLEEIIESVSFSLLCTISTFCKGLAELWDFGEALTLCGRLLDEEMPEDSAVELFVNETIDEVHEASCDEDDDDGVLPNGLVIFFSIFKAESSALWVSSLEF